MKKPTDLHRVLEVLRGHTEELRGRGVSHASVFGSVARGDGVPDSDVDILVTLDPEARVDAFAYAGIMIDLEQWLGRPVDMARRDKLKSHVRPQALKEEVRAF